MRRRVVITGLGTVTSLGHTVAESWGRRPVAAIGLVLGVIGNVLGFLLAGPLLWLAKGVGNILGAIAVPAMAVYGPELFGTHDRGRANALIVTAGVAGSAIGLVTVGVLSDVWGNLGAPIALIGIAPLVVAALVLTRFPETAGLDLEELNPEDA